MIKGRREVIPVEICDLREHVSIQDETGDEETNVKVLQCLLNHVHQCLHVIVQSMPCQKDFCKVPPHPRPILVQR